MPLLRLQPLFDQFATLLRPTVIAPAQGSGFSGAEIFRCTTPLGHYALRCWPAEHPTSGHIRTIHTLLSRAFEHGCSFIPVPVANLHGETLLEFAGFRWQLEPWMPGTPDLERQPRREHLAGAFAALARLHRAFSVAGSGAPGLERSPALLERIRVLEGCLAGDLHRVLTAFNNEYLADWDDRVRRYMKLFERAAPAVDRLLRRAASCDYALQPVVRDVHREHILFTGDEVSGIVDFGALTVDTPAIDLARLLGSYEIDDAARRDVLLKAYFPPLSMEERWAVEAFDKSGALLSPFRWLWWLFVERRTFRDSAAVAHRFDVLLQRLTRLVDDSKPRGEISFSDS